MSEFNKQLASDKEICELFREMWSINRKGAERACPSMLYEIFSESPRL